MQDDKIKNIFDDFQPLLSDTDQFIARLQKNMEAVEMLKQHNTAMQRRQKLAVAIATACGFVSGIVITLLLPLVGNWLSTLDITLSHLNICSLTIDISYVAWIIVASACIITALSTYEIALTKLPPQKPKRCSN